MNKFISLLIISSCIIAQGVNPLIWSPVEEDNRFIQQVWGQVCNGTGILNSDTDNCNTQWGQHQLEIDIDNDGDNLIDSEDSDEIGSPRESALSISVRRLTEDIVNELTNTW